MPRALERQACLASEEIKELKRILIGLLKVYQWTLSPLVGPCCRFYPTCSNYMITAIEIHGVYRGLWFGVKRLLKCHPLHPGGVDPVPATAQSQIHAR